MDDLAVSLVKALREYREQHGQEFAPTEDGELALCQRLALFRAAWLETYVPPHMQAQVWSAAQTLMGATA